VHLRGEESHGCRKAIAAEPAQDFLGAVREKHDAQHQAHEGEGGVVDRGQQLLEHEHLRAEDGALRMLHRLKPAVPWVAFDPICARMQVKELAAGKWRRSVSRCVSGELV